MVWAESLLHLTADSEGANSQDGHQHRDDCRWIARMKSGSTRSMFNESMRQLEADGTGSGSSSSISRNVGVGKLVRMCRIVPV